MPLINENLKAQDTEAFDQSFKSNQQTNAFSTNSQNFNQPNSNQGLFHIPEKFLQLIPWIPIGLEMLTGQKIPPIGALADILQGIQQLQFKVQQVLNQQQLIWNKLESLESNASQQLTNLSQQVANTNSNFKLLATETKRSLEFSRQPQLETETN